MNQTSLRGWRSRSLGSLFPPGVRLSGGPGKSKLPRVLWTPVTQNRGGGRRRAAPGRGRKAGRYLMPSPRLEGARLTRGPQGCRRLGDPSLPVLEQGLRLGWLMNLAAWNQPSPLCPWAGSTGARGLLGYPVVTDKPAHWCQPLCLTPAG